MIHDPIPRADEPVLPLFDEEALDIADYLKAEHIQVVSKDVLDIYPRKVCFLPASGKAMVKRLASANTEALLAQERAAATRAAPAVATGGSVDLF